MTGMGLASLRTFTPPTVTGAVLALGGSGLKNSSDDAEYGMSMWFRVNVSGIGGSSDLGRWSACSGLKVTFKTEQVKSGTGIDRRHVLPVGLEYGDIELSRAMEDKPSADVRAWLKKVADEWIYADDGGSDQGFPGVTVTIALYSALKEKKKGSKDHKVAEWVLEGAFPKTWTGPSLNASGNEIAIEKISFAHAGFLKPREPQNTITLKDAQDRVLIFDRHPENMSFSQAIVSASAMSRAQASDAGSLASDPNKLNIKFKAQVEGRTRVEYARSVLFYWLKSLGVDEIKTGDKTDHVEIRRGLLLRIGSGSAAKNFVVTLQRADTTVTRFTPDGLPSRAAFQLDFEVLSPPFKNNKSVSGLRPLPAAETEAKAPPQVPRRPAQRTSTPPVLSS